MSTTHSSASNLKTLTKSLQSHSSKTAPPSRIGIDSPCIVSFPQTSKIDSTPEAAPNQLNLLYMPLPVNVLGFPPSPSTKHTHNPKCHGQDPSRLRHSRQHVHKRNPQTTLPNDASRHLVWTLPFPKN
ncbi:hypothetical protein BCR33DRAFT_516108 [Rhizoclosmatium globosum]|uniref:Uncharacterized protein n=1 Tax=Rhizoclosmatium globosum TaxID=329046 RepID=A0A1Y2BG88_9FUNG|nr:hypothetical protein BCR33DRAFT_516108 [Rhizoclosmatium globosum]|eukprot:ORY33822.1 hypothetical protein BCR33DRAFT_516108 [Rhizoclosmatium globosum]